MSDSPQEHPFRSAEEWLAERGVEREPIKVVPPPEAADRPPVSPREAVRLAQASERNAPSPEAGRTDQPPAPGRDHPDLGDEVAKAVAYVRRSTAQHPQPEARLRDKLRERGDLPVVIDRALARCRDEGLIDDESMARALVEERQRRGHAPLRIRTDLEQRGFDRALVDRLLAAAENQDQEAAAFDVARQRAGQLRGVTPDTAYRRLASYLARRGYPEGLARKVARQVIYVDREHERIAGH